MDNQSMDNKIKKYFENRNIEPTSQAWDRLDSMLTTAEKPKKRFTLHFLLAFAACMISILMMFLGSNDHQIKTALEPNKVEISQNKEVKEGVQVIENELIKAKVEIEGNQIKKKINTRKVAKSDVSPFVQNQKKSDDISVAQPTIAVVVPENQSSKIIAFSDVTSIEVSSTNVEEKKSTFKIDPEALLASISTVKTESNKAVVASNVKKNRIDPNALLDEAENAVAKGFLVRALSSFKETSDEILTSVSNRNQVKQ